jgi:hypothetical protein
MPPMPPDDELADLVEQITVDAYGDEGYWSFLQAFEDGVQFPFAATIAGIAGVVTKVDFDGDERRGLVATLDRDGESYTVSLLDIAAPNAPDVVRLLAAYKRWLGMM